MCDNLVGSAECNTVAQAQQGDQDEKHIPATLIERVHNTDQTRATQPCMEAYVLCIGHVEALTNVLSLLTYAQSYSCCFGYAKLAVQSGIP